MSEPSQFRHYQIIQDADGNNVELVRNAEQVAVLSFDMKRLEYAQCHVLLEPLANRSAFNEACGTLQKRGHPALARLIEFGEDEGNPFYITSNVDGEPLRSYLTRQQELPGWLAIMIASRALETAVAVCERGEFLTDASLESFRILQSGPQAVQVIASDFRVLENTAAKKRALKGSFEKQAKFLRAFLSEQGSGPALADHSLQTADFTELLEACLAAASVGSIAAMRELRSALQQLAPDALSGEIPTAQKPRALLAPLLANYQEVARGLVNLVRVQSQRLDMANPYSMRGTLTKTGRTVLIEQVPPSRISCAGVKEADIAALKATQQRGNASLLTLSLVNDADDITCLAEEVVEGISLADVMRERRYLEVQEAYLVLAALDSALEQLERSSLPTAKLRLEDVFLLTGFAREDPRSTKLLVSKLNEWPAFNVIVRAHPTLSSMCGRGTDPAVLMPPARHAGDSPWHAGWLAALCRFLLGLDAPVGMVVDPQGGARERETVARLLDEELAKVADSKPAQRADFLARYARIIQHYDLVSPGDLPVKPAGTKPATVSGLTPSPKTTPVSKPHPAPVKRDPMPAAKSVPAAALTTGGSESRDTPYIGFAELLFKNADGDAAPPDAPDWARAAATAPPTLPEHFVSDDGVPMWLKAAVFIGGSMVLGGIFAHFSGDALWLKRRAAIPSAGTGATAFTPAVPASSPAAPKAIPIEAPVVMPPPDDDDASSGRGVSLSLPPGAGGLREQLTSEPPPTPPR
ncbi:MAG: hypothetical protein R3F13_09185 [Prosthecobacter sp.]